MLTLGLKQPLGLTVSLANGFGLFQQLNYNLSLNFTPSLQSAVCTLQFAFHTDRFLNPEITETLIHAFVISCLGYCNSLLYGFPNCPITKLQSVQNTATAARLTFKAPTYCHITCLLTKLHWLNIRHRIELKITLIVYKVVVGAAPEYIRELTLLKPASSYSLRSNNKCMLQPLTVKTLSTLGDRAFAGATVN